MQCTHREIVCTLQFGNADSVTDRPTIPLLIRTVTNRTSRHQSQIEATDAAGILRGALFLFSEIEIKMEIKMKIIMWIETEIELALLSIG